MVQNPRQIPLEILGEPLVSKDEETPEAVHSGLATVSGAKREPRRAGLSDLFAGMRGPAGGAKNVPKPEMAEAPKQAAPEQKAEGVE